MHTERADTTRQYEITHHTQETACDNCGCPLYVGDTVYLSDDEARAYCSQSCARAGERNTAALQCCVCGEDAGTFEQHWNRDAGYGICGACAKLQAARLSAEEMKFLYGIAGINYAVPAGEIEREKIRLGTCNCAEEIERRGSVAGHLYPLTIYTCPNGHEAFYCRAAWGAVIWTCPDCNTRGVPAGCDGEGWTWLRAARLVKGDPKQAERWKRDNAPQVKPEGTNGVQVGGWWV